MANVKVALWNQPGFALVATDPVAGTYELVGVAQRLLIRHVNESHPHKQYLRSVDLTAAITTGLATKQDKLQFKDEGAVIAAAGAVAAVNFTGPGVVASYLAGVLTVTISAGGGGIARSVASIAVNTAAGAVAATDYVYVCTAALTLTLPTAVANSNCYTVKNSGAGVVSVATTAAQTIDGGAAPITLNPGQSLDFISDNSNWQII